MTPIAPADISDSSAPNRARALAVAGVFLLAAAGQLALEAAGAGRSRTLMFALLAFAGAAALAVLALRRGELLPDPARPLELPRYPARLHAACLPGAIVLLAALWVHAKGSPADSLAAKLWLAGLALLLLPGAWDWFRRPGAPSAAEKRERRRILAATLFLFAFAFVIRIWGGIERIPGFLDSDEASTAMDGRTAFGRGLPALFGYWDFGSPSLTLFVSQLAALPFGEGLRALRLGSALLGSLSVVLLFDFGRRLVGCRAAFLAALLLAANHVFLHYSRVGEVFIDTPFFASLVLALLLRVLSGRSFLALTAAGIALGIGAATYIATEILPILIVLTLVGWAMLLRWPAGRVLPLAAFLLAVVALTCAPMVATILRITPEIAYQRVPAISVLRPDGLRQLAGAYQATSSRAAIGEHVLRTVGIFNFGSDHFKAYGANRPINDAVSAALIPVSAALLLWRLSTPFGWIAVIFTGAYLTGGVLLSASQPTFHRVTVVLLFSSLAIGWTLVGLTRALAGSVKLPRRAPAVLALAVVAASAWLNLHYYFAESPISARTEARFGLGRLICRYAETHRVLDATGLAGYGSVPRETLYRDLECPGARTIRIEESRQLWDFSHLTDAPLVVLLVPEAVERDTPGRPSGYRLVRRTVDRSIRRPIDLPIAVLEFARAPESARSNILRR
jgi:4-amino-4-deoxy-L-arabinose transferase-like glycosyltransferase